MKFVKNLFNNIIFYFQNIIWNYLFWLNCRRKYVEYTFFKINDISGERVKVVKKRFMGFEYKGKVYQDNPGMPIKSKNNWKIYKKRFFKKSLLK
jgi:hypothetical protein